MDMHMNVVERNKHLCGHSTNTTTDVYEPRYVLELT